MSDGEEVRQGRNPASSADDEFSVGGGQLFGCQATPDVGPLGIAVGLWFVLRRLTRKQADGEMTHV